MHAPQLIVDLAIMLTTAALVTITFKKLKLPTILGYIVAGFLIGPNFPLFLDVESTSSIETWSEIGVIIILFHIGLEFDINKLSDIGSTAFVSAAVKMAGVMAVGYAFGMALGMSTMNSIFLGAMLSISSTVVIQKCFEEMGLTEQRFSKLVMGSLVMEDVIAVFMMVILTTIAAGQGGSEGAGTWIHLAVMIIYLIIWLVLGIYFVPTFLDRAMNLISRETLTLLSLGFCFLMALLANMLGFSMELGAFIAGSLFAGTRHVHKIEVVTSGIKDMFGAVFFLSVGMMVDPTIISARWTSIVPIAAIAVVAKLIFAMAGMMLSGQDMETAIRGGTSLAPIGEFSFIVASLGISLGVMDEYLYPVIVAASILTIIFTPVLIKNTDYIVTFFNKVLPKGIKRRIQNYTSADQDTKEHTSEWNIFLKEYFLHMLIYGSIMLVGVIAGCRLLYPLLSGLVGDTASKIICAILIYAVISIFAIPFLGRRNAAFTQLWMDRLANRPPLAVMIMLKVAVLVGIALVPPVVLFNFRNWLVFILVPLAVFAVSRSEFIATYYLQLETRFLSNLNQKTMEERGGSRERQHWLNEDYSITSWIVPDEAAYIGKSIGELDWGRFGSVYVVKLKRGDKKITMPSARTVLQAGDKVYTIGDRQSLVTFLKTINPKEVNELRTLKEFLDSTYPDKDHELACVAIQVRGNESYVNKPIKKSGITARTNCMILGIERAGYASNMPDANMLIEEGDILWIIGAADNVSRIAAMSSGEPGIHEDREAEAGKESKGGEAS